MDPGLDSSHSLEIQFNEPVTNQAKCVAAAAARKKNLGRKTTQINLTMIPAPAESRDRYPLDLRGPWFSRRVPLYSAVNASPHNTCIVKMA